MRQRIIISGVLLILFVALIAGMVALINASDLAPLPTSINLDQAVADTVAAFTAIPTHTTTPTITPTATRTPPPSSTPTATLSPTPPTENPALLFSAAIGAPTWKDTFDDDANWTLVNDSCIKTSIQDGSYVMTSKKVPSPTCWEVSWPRIQNFYLETTVYTPQGCDGKDRFGLIFRAPDATRGYLFGLTCENEYWLAQWDGKSGEGDFIIEFTENPIISIGSENPNTLGVLANQEQIVLYVNGTQLTEIFDDTFTDSGLIGLFIGAYETEGLTVEYSELKYWQLP